MIREVQPPTPRNRSGVVLWRCSCRKKKNNYQSTTKEMTGKALPPHTPPSEARWPSSSGHRGPAKASGQLARQQDRTERPGKGPPGGWGGGGGYHPAHRAVPWPDNFNLKIKTLGENGKGVRESGPPPARMGLVFGWRGANPTLHPSPSPSCFLPSVKLLALGLGVECSNIPVFSPGSAVEERSAKEVDLSGCTSSGVALFARPPE